jgi:hypothetical protein
VSARASRGRAVQACPWTEQQVLNFLREATALSVFAHTRLCQNQYGGLTVELLGLVHGLAALAEAMLYGSEPEPLQALYESLRPYDWYINFIICGRVPDVLSCKRSAVDELKRLAPYKVSLYATAPA